MSNIFENKGALATTIVVAASNSLNRGAANYVCDGVNDHIEIQAALDALPATGGEVVLLDGTYNIEVSLVMDSYQTLRGNGRNTILTTTTANLDIITATGAGGAEKIGITIADLCVDGAAGGAVNDDAIYWRFVDYSTIHHCWIRRNKEWGIDAISIDYDEISDCVFEENGSGGANEGGIHSGACTYIIIANNRFRGDSRDSVFFENLTYYCTIIGNTIELSGGNYRGLSLEDLQYCAVMGNIVRGYTRYGIYLWGANSFGNTVVGNTCSGNEVASTVGIFIATAGNAYNVIANNVCYLNGQHGIYIEHADHNIIEGNECYMNSRETDNTYDQIYLSQTASYNSIQNNMCRRGAAGNRARYGINISAIGCEKNIVLGNDLYDAGTTANFNDAGLLTHVEDNNRGIEITQIKHFRKVTNTSGGAFVVGDVVILKAVAAGNEVTTPAAVGSDDVYGMVAEAIADAASGLVQVKGKTVELKATNAGGNIAIGDKLCTEIGVRSQLAAAGDQAFARALEACAVADGVIDAYIVSPWD